MQAFILFESLKTFIVPTRVTNLHSDAKTQSPELARGGG